MRLQCVQILLVFGLVVAQDLFVKENKFLAQHGLTIQAMKPTNANLTTQVGHDWWVFQITLRSNPMLCMDLTGENDENGSPIGIWECNGHESQLWYFDGGTYQINWAGNSQKCLDAGNNLQAGNPLMIWDCNGQDAQTWGYDSDMGTVYLVNDASDASLCLDVTGGDLSQGNVLEVWDCNGLDGQQFGLQAGITIRSFQDYQMCVDLPGGDTTDGTNLWLWQCNGGSEQYWVFDTDDNNAIKLAADLSKCIDAGSMEAGSTLMIWDCNGLPSQSFGYDVDTFSLYSSWSSQSDASLCVDLANGGLGNGAAIDLWNCNDCWNQQFQAWGPSSALARSTHTLGDVVEPLSSWTKPKLKVADSDCPQVPSPGPSPGPPSPTPSPDIPSDVFMPDCNLAASGWPTFNSQSDLQGDSEWSHYFQTVYGEIPSSGYPICVGAFMQMPRRGGLTSFSAQQCHGKTLSDDGALVDRMSDCCDAPNVNFIYNSKNTRHAVPDNTWFEGMHITKTGDKGAAWYYQTFGSAIWVYTGTTKVFKDHPDATSYFLHSSCNDQNHHSKPATECENDFTKWFKQAKTQGLQSIQFTDHFDCGCGEEGTSSWSGHDRLCYTEIIDLLGDGSKGCASGFYKAGWAAANDCDCDSSKKYSNCKGFGLG